MNIKKTTSILLIGVICAASLVGCGKNPNKSATAGEASGEFPLQTDVELTYWCPLPSNISSFTDNCANTVFSEEYEKRTGVKIKYIHPVAGQEKESLSLLIASGELPDIISTNWLNYQGGPSQAIDEGVIVDLGQYKDYAPNYFKILEENHDYDKAVSTDDGKYYGFATINSGEKLLTVSGPSVRKDWLDELGMDYPETIDEWETMLRIFKEKKNASIPFSFDYGSISTVFGMFEARFDPMVKDGKVVYGPAQPEFKRALETMNKWFNEGLLDKNIVSVDKSLLESQILSGKTGATFTPGGTGIGSLQTAGAALDPKFSLNAAPYPTYEKGATNSAVKVLSPVEGYALAITTSCQHPEIAARVLDYLYSDEGNELANFGIEGETFNYVDGKPVYTDLLTKNPEGLTMAQALGKYVRVGTGNGFVVREEYIEQYYGLPQQQSIFDFWAKNVKSALAETVPAIKVTADESAEYSDIMNEVNKYRNQMIVKFITGIESIDNFDKYVETLNKYGLEKAMDIKTKALERYNAR